MPEPGQELQPQNQQPKKVRVFGPDNRYYSFPEGTTKEKAVAFFKQKGITSAESKPPKLGSAAKAAPPTTPEPQKETPPEESKYLKDDQSYQFLKHFSQGQYRPRWDKPDQILNDPTWYGKSARYAGGEFIGASRAGAGVAAGGWKMLNDVASAINPFEVAEQLKKGQSSPLYADIKGAGQGIRDVGKDVWDLIRHFPEASSDPEHLGNTVANAAMIVDGGVKTARSIADLMKTDPAEAARVAHNAANKAPSKYFKRKAFEDAYVHSKGLDVAKKVNKAAKSIDMEVKTHAGKIAEQIDTALPSGVIDAADEANVIKKEFNDVVKTPEAAHPLLRQMLADADKTAPGQWTWDKARQFRSSVGRSMGKVSGPQRVVLTKVYKDLTNKLASSAKQYGLEDSWNHYNELERKVSQQFGDHIDAIRDSQSGKEVAGHLNRDPALTQETVKNLSKYGLDVKELQKFMKDSTRIAKQQKGWTGTLFRMAYGTPMGVPVMLAAKAAGAGWMGSVGAGALVGYASTALINAMRAAKLSPDVIEHMMSERELPGRRPVSTGVFPGPDAPPLPGLPSPSPDKPTPQLPESSSYKPSEKAQSLKEKPKDLGPEFDTATKEHMIQRYRDILKNPKATKEDVTEANARLKELGATESHVEKPSQIHQGGRWYTDKGSIPGEPREYLDATKDSLDDAKAAIIEHETSKGTKYEAMTSEGESLGTFDHIEQARAAAEKKFTKVPEGQHGKGKLAVQAKARERVSKAREGAKRTRDTEIQESQARARATDMDTSKLQIPEMEEALKSMNPKALSGLQKLRKAKSVSDPEYQEALRYYILEAYEKRGGGTPTEE